MTSEIIEEKDEDTNCFINTEAEKKRIKEIIEYQKSLYWSSSSSSSLASTSVASSTFSSSNKSARLLDLMKSGDTSLRRLFDMEHTSLATHFQEYSCSPITKTIPLWGSETDNEMGDPWAELRRIRTLNSHKNGVTTFASDGSSKDPELGFKDKRATIVRSNLSRKKSFRRLPGFCLWRIRRFRFRFRPKRLRIMICGKMFRI